MEAWIGVMLDCGWWSVSHQIFMSGWMTNQSVDCLVLFTGLREWNFWWANTVGGYYEFWGQTPLDSHNQSDQSFLWSKTISLPPKLLRISTINDRISITSSVTPPWKLCYRDNRVTLWFKHLIRDHSNLSSGSFMPGPAPQVTPIAPATQRQASGLGDSLGGLLIVMTYVSLRDILCEEQLQVLCQYGEATHPLIRRFLE